MTTLRKAAQAVLDRWDSPAWEWVKQGPTADLMADLRAALAEPVQEPLTDEAIDVLSNKWSDKDLLKRESADVDAMEKAKIVLESIKIAMPYTFDEMIDEALRKIEAALDIPFEYDALRVYARAIERAHGIGEQA